MKTNLKQIAKVIKKSNKIAIFTHTNPDYDAFGSALSLYYACKLMNKDVDIYMKDELTKAQQLLINPSVFAKQYKNKDYDVLISTDVSAGNLLGDYEGVFISASNNVVIDHHSSESLVGTYTFRDATYSSCSEIVLKLIKLMKVKITEQIASLIYIGLSGDTNSFTNINVTKNSFDCACECANYGANIVHINEIMYRTKTNKEAELEKILLNTFVRKKDIAYCVVTLDTLQKIKASKNDCDFYSSKLISMEGVNISFSIIESKPNFYNVSFRAKYGHNVRDVASELGGGGHIGAAGAKLEADSIEKLTKKVLNIIKKQREKNGN